MPEPVADPRNNFPFILSDRTVVLWASFVVHARTRKRGLIVVFGVAGTYDSPRHWEYAGSDEEIRGELDRSFPTADVDAVLSNAHRMAQWLSDVPRHQKITP